MIDRDDLIKNIVAHTELDIDWSGLNDKDLQKLHDYLMATWVATPDW